MKINVTDYKGRPVILKSSTWEEHIKPNHPEMDGHLHDIEASVTTPLIVTRDMMTVTQGEKEVKVPNPNREECYGIYTTSEDMWRIMKTIVDYSTNPGEIVTSTIVGRGKIDTSGGVLYDARQKK